MRAFFKNSENRCVLCLYLLAVSVNATISLMGPFFPSEALRKGMQPSISGAVFSVYSIAEMIGSAVIGKCLPVFGHRNVLLFGMFALSSSNIIFGLLHFVDNYTVFTISCFVTKTFEAIGKSMVLITSLSLIMNLSSDKSATRIGIYHSCTSIGYSLSPLIGTVLYATGGYMLPFIVLGSITLLHLPYALISIERTKKSVKELESLTANESLSYSRILKNAPIIFILFSIFLCSLKIGVNAATFELHLLTIKHSHTFVGAMFTTNAVMFSILCVIVGFISSKLNAYIAAFIGLTADSIAFSLLGPSLLLNTEPNVYFASASMVLFAIGGSMCIVTSMPFMLNSLKQIGCKDTETVNSLVSAVYSFIYAFGTVFGSSIGGFGIEYFGYLRLSTFCSTLSAIGALVVLSFHLFIRRDDTNGKQQPPQLS